MLEALGGLRGRNEVRQLYIICSRVSTRPQRNWGKRASRRDALTVNDELTHPICWSPCHLGRQQPTPMARHWI